MTLYICSDWQVLTYTEDFHTERSDRQRAQAALHRLEEERDNLQKTIAMLVKGYKRVFKNKNVPFNPSLK